MGVCAYTARTTIPLLLLLLLLVGATSRVSREKSLSQRVQDHLQRIGCQLMSRERERSLFAISLTTSHIRKSINGRLPERKNSTIAGHL